MKVNLLDRFKNRSQVYLIAINDLIFKTVKVTLEAEL